MRTSEGWRPYIARVATVLLGLAATPVATPGPQVVGPGGGTAVAPNEAVILTIPSGALARSATFDFTVDTQLPGSITSYSPVTGVWSVSATDSNGPLKSLKAPITVSMLYSGPSTSVIYRWTGKAWQSLSMESATRKGYLTATTDRLGVFSGFASIADLNQSTTSSTGPPFFLLGILIIVGGLVLATFSVLYPRVVARRNLGEQPAPGARKPPREAPAEVPRARPRRSPEREPRAAGARPPRPRTKLPPK